MKEATAKRRWIKTKGKDTLTLSLTLQASKGDHRALLTSHIVRGMICLDIESIFK
jgi:hypothetical protein